MRVLITGATGFLGSHVAEQLLQDGHTVRALVRPTSNTSLLEAWGVELVTASLEKGDGLKEAVRGVDGVVHCAGVVKARSVQEFHEVNAGGTERLLDAVKHAAPDLKRFVYVSSLAAHGPSEDGQPRHEHAEPRPVTHYGRSKLAGEQIALAAQNDLPVTVIRPPAIYGPRDEEMYAFFRSVSRRLVPLIGAGENRVSVVFAEDCARAIVHALEKDHPSGRTYFVEDGNVYSWEDMGKLLEEALGVRALRVRLPIELFTVAALGSEFYGKVRKRAVMLTRDKVNELKQSHFVCTSKAIRDDLGWEPRVDFARGAKTTAQWYRAHGWL